MNADLYLNLASIINDTNNMIMTLKSKTKNNKTINYISSYIGNIENTFEILYDILENKYKHLPERKAIILFIEIIKFMLKIKEFKQLNKEGYNFYVEKSIYYSQILNKNEDEAIFEIENIDSNNILQIKKKKSKKNYITKPNLIKVPDKIVNSKLNKIEFNSTDDSITEPFTNSVQDKFVTNPFNQDFNVKFKEILYLLRPIIYLVSLMYFKENKIPPLLISLIIDYLYLDRNVGNKGNFSKQKIYHYEYAFRIRKLILYLVREPIISYVTVPLMRKILQFIRMPETVIKIAELILRYFTKYYYIL